jgi:hypothetical protein
LRYAGGRVSVEISKFQLTPSWNFPPIYNDSGEHRTFDVSMTGSRTINNSTVPFTATGSAFTSALFKSPFDTTGTFDTQMVQLTVTDSSNDLVRIRKHLTRSSTGKTTITDIGGGRYHISSFFDVFTELSLDGGATWIPSISVSPASLPSGYIRITVVPEPSFIWLLTIGMAAMGCIRDRRGR